MTVTGQSPVVDVMIPPTAQDVGGDIDPNCLLQAKWRRGVMPTRFFEVVDTARKMMMHDDGRRSRRHPYNHLTLALATLTRLGVLALTSPTVRVCMSAIGIVAAILVSPVDVGAQRPTAKSDQDTLEELERDWNHAFERKDIAFIRGVLAEEFTATYEDGSQGDKAKELSLTEAFDQHVDSSVQEDFAVKVYGDTAVVSFTLHLVGPKQGIATTVLLRYVDVFVWRDGRWQCVSSQSTKVTSG